MKHEKQCRLDLVRREMVYIGEKTKLAFIQKKKRQILDGAFCCQMRVAEVSASERKEIF